MNTVSVIGNLATDVEVRDVGDEGKRGASFLLAVDRTRRGGVPDFFGVSVWDGQGELCAEHLGKGHKVAIEGYLRSRSWEDEGKRRRQGEIVARRVDFLANGRRDEAGREGSPCE